MNSIQALCSLILWLVCASFGLVCGTIVAAACLYSMAKLHIAVGVLLAVLAVPVAVIDSHRWLWNKLHGVTI